MTAKHTKIDMDNRGTSADVVFEYTGVGCSVPKDITSVRFNDGLTQKIGDEAFNRCTSLESITLPSRYCDRDW